MRLNRSTSNFLHSIRHDRIQSSPRRRRGERNEDCVVGCVNDTSVNENIQHMGKGPIPSVRDDVVDLTMETSSDSGLTADEVVVAAAVPTAPVTIHYKKGDSIRARWTSPSVSGLPPRHLAPASKLSRAPSLSPSVSRRRTPHASPAGKSTTAAADGTPSKPARRSSRTETREIRDSQSPPPSIKSTAKHRHPTPQSSTRTSRSHHMPSAQTPKRMEWGVDRIASALNGLSEEVSQGHARLVDFLLEEAEKTAQQRQHLSIMDAFSDSKSIALDNTNALPSEVETMAVKFKQHSGEYGKSKGNGRRALYPVICIKPDREPVPGYRFHHVELRKNILAPNSMLNFVPHLRDVDPNSAEEQKYSNWLTDLENLDSKSGFQIQNRSQKLARRAQNEYAAALTPYLEPWLRKLAIDGCTKPTLIRYMASQPQNEDAITPQQKSNLLDTYSSDMGSARGAKLFTEAFDRVFNDSTKPRRVALRDILMLDKSVEPILENKRAKDGPSAQKPRDEALIPRVAESLGSYSILGCLICFSHDCEHGEIERDNQKRCFSLEEIGGVAPTLRAKWAAQVEAQKKTQTDGVVGRPTHQPCRNQCYRSYDTGNPKQDTKPWAEHEVSTLEAVFATIGHSSSLRPECLVGAVLGRYCWDVHRKLKELDLTLPPVEPRGAPAKPPKAVPWYDRKKKQLLGDWQDATITHEHAVRELYAPCHHEGPCTAANGCPCASGGSHPVLCERFCHCTADECALKFTGCACHSSGKTCIQRQKEGRPCICVQLNRECDPVLCRGCGARERADPENAYDEQLHATGCQNVAMQRGAAKALLLGKSQLEMCGYGLFAAEDIAQDEFVIEYIGELISHDEGVRREHRRGDPFDEENKVSYLFTLLEQEGIWVDAAIYGNLSRYINHASDTCNIMPRIMYVNHEFRIKFLAIRDIKAGDELFFNYGDNFPNLTKKLVERSNEKLGDGNNTSAVQKRKSGPGRGTARKTTSKANGEGIGFGPDERGEEEDFWLGELPPAEDDDVGDDWENTKRRKKRGGKRPGAGRKRKHPPRAVPAAENGDAIPPEPPLLTESSSIGGVAANPITPTRRRALKRSFSGMLNPQPSVAGSEAASGAPAELPFKKISKRGGARPGAGRKPKHPRPPGAQPRPGAKAPAHASQSSLGSSASGAETTPKRGAPDAAVATPRTSRSRPDPSVDTTPKPAASRKHIVAELDAEHGVTITAATIDNAAAAAGPYRQDTFRPIDDDTSRSGSHSGSRMGDDDDDDDDMADRSARKRQKPLRYRDEEE